MNKTGFFKIINIELIFWICALILLAFTNPNEHHFTLCPFSNLGFKYCPGCGIGRSIAYLFRGDIIHSFQMHPLGIFALAVIDFRIYQIINNQYIHKQTQQ
ncbi:MAG: DUF2752 domain-containing protein [Bacteroidetes bacterium]|nr:DUF2752 domain-containing protein [Bacteroidota bacterium]